MDFAFKNMIRNMPVACGLFEVIPDDSGRPSDCVFLEINERFEELTARRAAEVLGRRVSAVFPGRLGGSFDILGACADAALTGEPQNSEFFFPGAGPLVFGQRV